MDHQEREMLAQEIGCWFESYFENQTKHLIEAMPCLCHETYIKNDIVIYVSKGEHCNRCNKLNELEPTMPNDLKPCLYCHTIPNQSELDSRLINHVDNNCVLSRLLLDKERWNNRQSEEEETK